MTTLLSIVWSVEPGRRLGSGVQMLGVDGLGQVAQAR